MTIQRFAYKALDAQGKSMDGFMDAATAEEVGAWLTDRQYYVLEVSAAPVSTLAAAFARPRRVRISRREMNYLLIQLSSLLNAGCPLIMSLQALHRQLSVGPLKALLQDIKEEIETGKSFSDALKNHPQVFSNLFITMVEVGEVGGILDQVLERYSRLYDAMYRIRAKVISSMIYPAILLCVTVVVAWALLVLVFPHFIASFEGTAQPLPLITRLVLHASDLLREHSWRLIFSLLGGSFLLSAVWKSESGRRMIDRAGLQIPLVGTLIGHIELALFARTLGTLLKCGVPILTSLGAVERAHGNTAYKDAMAEIRAGVARGESLSQGMARCRDLFPDSLILMADVGEQSGNTGEMLEKAGQIYERDLETTIDALVSLIQPSLVIFLSNFVVALALAMYMPLFDLIRMMR